MPPTLGEFKARLAELVKQYNARRHEQWPDLTKLQGELAAAAGRLCNEFRRLGVPELQHPGGAPTSVRADDTGDHFTVTIGYRDGELQVP